MSIYLKDELWVTVCQMEGGRAPRPLPLESGFCLEILYKVLGIHSVSETSEAYFILCNDREELWFISNRHFRVVNAERYRMAPGATIEVSPMPLTLR